MIVTEHPTSTEIPQAVLRNGHNEQIRRLAQEIIVTQQQEIAAMRLAVGEVLPPSVPSPTQVDVSPSSRFTTTSFVPTAQQTGVPR